MPDASDRRTAAWLPALIAPLAFTLLLLPALDFPFVWEDEGAIAAGSMLRPAGETLLAFREPLHRIPLRGAAARQAYYRPLPVVALSLIDQSLGREPRHFRALTIASGALCVAAFGLFAGWLFGRAGPALFAALFVALHPVTIEATVWIAGMPATLCALFVIAALGCALAAVQTPSPQRAAGWGALSTACLALALLSKEQAAVTPVLLVATLLSLAAPRDRRRALALVLLQTLVVAAWFFGLRPAVLGSAFMGLPPIGGSFATQILTAVASWPRELGWIFAPLRSSTSDTVEVVTSLASAGFVLGLLLALGSLALWWMLRRRGARIAALGLAWIWIAFAPTAGLLPQLHASGERYLFFSAFGAALLLADLGARWLPGAPPAWRRAVAPAIALVAFAGLAERTRARLPDWSSTRRLFEADLARDPAYREAHLVLALEKLEAGRFVGARARLAPLLENDPRFEGTAGYLNWLLVAEAACLSALGAHDFEGVLALEARWQREFTALARAPTVRLCAAQARDGLGRTEEALSIYTDVSRELGAAAPPELQALIAHRRAALGLEAARGSGVAPRR